MTNNQAAWSLNIDGIIFNSGAASFTILGNSLGLTNTGDTPKIENNSANTQTISLNDIALRNTAEFNPSGGNLVFNGANVFLDSSLRVWGDGGHSLILNTVLSQGGGLGIQQNSTVLFQKTNTYSGATFIHAGQLVISNDARAGTGAINLGGTNLIGNSFTNALYLGTSASGGGVTNTNAININAGGGASTIGANNTSGINSFTGPIALSRNLNINNGGGTLTINGAISGTGFGITKQGAGILILSNANTYTGATTVSGGTLRLGAADRIANDSALSVGTGATFDLNNFSETLGAISGAGSISLGSGTLTTSVGAASTFSGTLSGSGGLTKNGNSTLTLSGNSSSFTGAVAVTAGAVRVSNAGALGNTTGATAVSSGAALELTVSPGAEAISLNGTGISSGGALRNISGNNTLSGLITLAGASRINSDAGTLTLDVSTGSAITGTHNLSIGGAGNVTVNDNIGIATGTLTKDGAGVLTLAGTHNYTGATTVTNGTLVVNGSIAGSAVSVGNSATQNGSVLTGTGTVGATTINNNGRISPGNSVGTLTVSNSLTLNNGGSYLWEINQTNGPAGTTWDLISVDTATVGAGTLNLPGSGTFIVEGVAIDGFVFDGAQNYTGNYFQIIRAGTVTGAIGNLSFSASGLGAGAWTFATNNTGLYLNYAAPGVERIFNNAAAADQGGANIVVGGNAAGAFNTIIDDGGVTAVVISNSAPMTFTNGANSYSGTTKIEQGTLVTTADAPNGANGAFGNAISTVDVGSTSAGNANAANLLIGSGGVTVGRGITIVAGGTGTRTVGATNSSGTATYSGGILMNTNVTLSASNAAGTTLFSGALSGVGAVSVAGPGTVVLSGNNTFTNTVSIASGSTLVASNNNALGGSGGAATTVSSGGVLSLAGGISTAENITISGNGITAAGALRNINGANTNTGTITLAANATISADASTTLALNDINLGATTRQLTISNTGTVLVTGNMSTTDTNSTFFKLGTGSLVFSNTSGYTGGAQLQMGGGVVTLASGTFSTNNSTSRRAVDLGLNPDNSGSSLSTALYVNSGVTMSNSIYVAAGSGARILGTESTSGTATFNNEIYLDSTARLTAASGGTALFSGNFVNTGGITKIGDGTVILAGNNSASGAVTISNGTLAVTNGSAINGSVLVTIDSGATLSILGTENVGRFTGAGTVSVATGQSFRSSYDTASNSFAGTITGSGAFAKAGTGTLTLSGANNYAGGTTHEAGVLLVGNNSALGSGVYQVDFNNTTDTKTIAANGTGSFTLSQSNNIYNNLTLGEATGNTGKLTFAGGTFLGNEVDDTRTLTVAANNTHEFSGAITGNRGIIKAGTGTLVLSGNNTYGSTFQLNEGTVLVGNNNAFGTGFVQVQFSIEGTKTIASSSGTGYTIANNVNVFNDLNLGLAAGGTGSLNFSGTVYLGDEIGENRFITTAAGTGHTVSGAVTGNRGIVKQGAGTLTLSGANTSSGGLFIDGGTINLNGGSIAFSGIEVGGGVNGSAAAGDAAALRVSAGTFTQGITVNGNTNSSGIAGSRSIEFANSTGSATLSGPVVMEKTASISTAGGQGIMSGAISGAGGLTKTGSGTLTLSGASANTYSGTTTVSGGTLELGKSVSNAVNGNLVVGSGATLLLSSSDQVGSSTGQTVTLSGGTITRGAGVSEVFGNLNLTAASFLDFGSGAAGTVGFGTYTPSALTALSIANFTQGNTLTFKSNLTSSIETSAFAFTGSGGLGGYSWDAGSGTFTITAIPEPSTYLAAAGLLALFLWPARRRLLKDAKSILGLRPTGRDRIEAYRNA